MSNEVSKTEFLKRYLENEKETKLKKKKKTKAIKLEANIPRIKIVDENIDLKSINFGDKAEEDDDDEAPVIAEVIDERPMEVKIKELYESSRWKKVDSHESSQSNLMDSEKTFLPEHNVKSWNGSDSDISPIRKQKGCSDNDISPPCAAKQSKNKHDSDSDISPPRSHKQKTNYSKSYSSHKQNANRRSDQRKMLSKKHDSDDNFSSHHYKRNSQIESSSKRHDSNSNNTLPFHQINRDSLVMSALSGHNSDSYNSLPHHQTKQNHQMKSSSRRHDSDSDNSPLHHQVVNKNEGYVNNSGRQHDSDSDLSPPRSPSGLSSTKGKHQKLSKTLSGLKAGLQNSKSLQEEVQDLRKREKTELNQLDDEISGKNADTIIRDRKTGLKRDLNREQEDKNEKSEKLKEYQQKYDKWGKGTEQGQDKLEKFKDDLYEMSKPLARYNDDEDLDERLRLIIHDDDPMSEYIKKKRKKDTPSYPVYSGPPAPPNRFGIQPGYRWDGVDRSNGFEAKYFQKINTTKAVQDEAYLWSVQDM